MCSRDESYPTHTVRRTDFRTTRPHVIPPRPPEKPCLIKGTKTSKLSLRNSRQTQHVDLTPTNIGTYTVIVALLKKALNLVDIRHEDNTYILMHTGECLPYSTYMIPTSELLRSTVCSLQH